MDPLSWLYIGLLVVSVFMCGFYSATETAFACLNKYRFKVQAEEGDKTSALIVRLFDHFDTTLITVLIGNNVFAILISTVSTLLFLDLFSKVLDEGVISLIASLSMSFLVFLFGDTIPKFLGKRIPNKIARISVYPLSFFIFLFYPLSLLFRGISFLTRKIFHASKTIEVTEDDFTSFVEDAEKNGELESNESDIIQATLEFDDTSAKEVWTPLRRMKMINLQGMSTEKLLAFLKDCPYSRIPCYVGEPDRIVGILVVKNYLSSYFADPTTHYLRCLQKPYFVSPNVKIDDLVRGFREHHTQIAVVRSRDKKVLGMVTAEDVLEELVGKIAEPTVTEGGVSK